MKQIQVEPLTLESFSPYGAFADMLSPKGVSIGQNPVIFFRDMLECPLDGKAASLSCCVVTPRPLIIDEAEEHSHTAEVTLPLDGDIIIFVGEATPEDIPEDRLRIFYVPSGTAVVIKPGIWHGAPFPAKQQTVHALVVLPQRTYTNDCVVKTLSAPVTVQQ